jgi:hypothetical protein
MNNFKIYKGSGQGQSKSKKPRYFKPYGKDEFRTMAVHPITHMELFTKENYQEMSIINIPTELDRSVQISFLSWGNSPDVIKHTITQENNDDQYFNALQILKNLIDPTDEDLASHANITVPLLKTKNELGIPNMELALISFLRNSIDFVGTTKKTQSLQNSEDIALNTISLEYHDKKYISGRNESEYDESWDSFNILKSQRQDGTDVDYPLNQALKVWLAYLEFYQYFPMEPEKEWIYKLNGKDVPDWKVIAQKNGIDTNSRASRSVGTARYKLFLEYLKHLDELVPILKEEEKTAEEISILALQKLLGDLVNTSQGDSKTDDVASEKKQEASQQQSVSESLSLKDYSDSKYESLRTQLKSFKLKIVPVADNGDCMFEAMSKFLIEQGIDVNTRDVRTIIVKHIADNWREYLDEIAVRGGCFNPSQTSGNDNDYRDWCHYPTKYQKVMMMEPNEQGQMPQGYPPQSRFGGASELAAFSKIKWGDQEKIFNFQLLIIGGNNELLGFTNFDNDNIHSALNLLLDQQNLHYSLLLPINEAAEKNNEGDSVPPVVPLPEDRQREDESVVHPVVQSEQEDIQKNTDYLKFLQFFDGVNQHYITQSEAYKQSTEEITKLVPETV